MPRDSVPLQRRVPGPVAIAMLTLAAVLVGGGCGGSPEQEIRDRIEEARVAAEAGKLVALRKMVSDNYEDARGNDRDALLALVGYYTRIEDGLHVGVRYDDIRITEPGKARIRLLVAAAAVPLAQLPDLSGVRAEVHDLTIDMVKQGRDGWLLTRADWAPATIGDFLR